MKKDKFHISIVNNNISDDYNTIGKYDDNTIEFYESDKLKSKVSIDLKTKKLIKENIDYKIEIEFNIDTETECIVYLKKEDKELRLKVRTLNYFYKDKDFKVFYNIIDDNEYVNYQIRIGG